MDRDIVEEDERDLMCTECNQKPGEIFLCGEGFFCTDCYDEALHS